MSLLVVPKPGSYVDEWEAVQVVGAEDLFRLRRLVKNTPWSVQMVLERDDSTVFVFTTQHAGGSLEQWTLYAGYWVVRSPHGKFWFMDDEQFKSQFEVAPGAFRP